ncbi:glycosyltransferase [Vibrio sp. T187]|uniref:glycosyltransferase n=1 Tax=Vibrio TaxID=662 RepID=UPI0010C9EB51|nr:MULTISPECIES: glycosyltransferase [Vibrio]MBW3697805.1 glycosyltransferase [Vibrio sp. T187]
MTMHNTQQDNRVHGFVYDPIAFAGGSKVATAEMLTVCGDKNVRFTILTSTPSSWSHIKKSNPDTSIISLANWSFLSQANGIRYWFAQLYFASMIFFTLLRIKRIDYAVGASGPGIDMALYICRLMLHFPIIQLIHGPVAPSRAIGYCLSQAKKVFYLESTYQSIVNALYAYFSLTTDPGQNCAMAKLSIDDSQLQVFTNGISQSQWPVSACYQSKRIFWAASLLEWKGLDILLSAIDPKFTHSHLVADICYIRPTSTQLGVSELPKNWSNVSLYESPSNLDQIRSQCGVFVSTSDNEPFGLSILESLAAGLSVVIPEDGAYWDKKLTHGVNCLKYNPRDELSLRTTLELLQRSTELRASLSIEGKRIAECYRAERCYAHITKCLLTGRTELSHMQNTLGVH